MVNDFEYNETSMITFKMAGRRPVMEQTPRTTLISIVMNLNRPLTSSPKIKERETVSPIGHDNLHFNHCESDPGKLQREIVKKMHVCYFAEIIFHVDLFCSSKGMMQHLLEGILPGRLLLRGRNLNLNIHAL